MSVLEFLTDSFRYTCKYNLYTSLSSSIYSFAGMHKSVQNIEFTPKYLFADMHKSVQQSHALTKTEI